MNWTERRKAFAGLLGLAGLIALLFVEMSVLPAWGLSTPTIQQNAQVTCPAVPNSCAVSGFSAQAVGDFLIVSYVNEGNVCNTNTVTDTVSTVFTKVSCNGGADIRIGLWWGKVVSTAADTITVNSLQVGSVSVVEYGSVSGIGASDSNAESSGSGTLTVTTTLTLQNSLSAVFQAATFDDTTVGANCNQGTITGQNNQVQLQSNCFAPSQVYYANEWNSPAPGSSTFSAKITGACSTSCNSVTSTVELQPGNSSSNQPGSSPYQPTITPPPANTITVNGIPLAYPPSAGPVTASQIVTTDSFNVQPGITTTPFIFVAAGLFVFTLGPYLLFGQRKSHPEYNVRIGI